MTQISREDVQNLALLSSLQLDDAEVDPLRDDIGRILSYVELLNELDTEKVEPTYQVTDVSYVTRDDEIDTYGIDREAVLALAPSRTENSIKVPKVL